MVLEVFPYFIYFYVSRFEFEEKEGGKKYKIKVKARVVFQSSLIDQHFKSEKAVKYKLKYFQAL